MATSRDTFKTKAIPGARLVDLEGSAPVDALRPLVRLLAHQAARQEQDAAQVSSSPDVMAGKVAKPPQPMRGSK